MQAADHHTVARGGRFWSRRLEGRTIGRGTNRVGAAGAGSRGRTTIAGTASQGGDEDQRHRGPVAQYVVFHRVFREDRDGSQSALKRTSRVSRQTCAARPDSIVGVT